MHFDEKPKVDRILLFLILLIPLLGLTVLYSAGYDAEYQKVILPWPRLIVKSPAFFKQSVFFFGALASGALVLCVPMSFWYRISPVIYLIGLLLLIWVGIGGSVVNGSRRWIVIGGLTIQPAEFVKLAVILFLARFMSTTNWQEGAGLRDLVFPALFLGMPMGLILKQPDLGTAIAVGAVGSFMIFFLGVRWRTIVLLGVALVSALVPLWNRLHTYQKNRILALFYPNLDPQGTGYHIKQSKIAIGSGELFGKGFLQGTQSQLEFLPEHTTDFVFSVLAEEFGFIGCALVLFAYLMLMWKLLGLAKRTPNRFHALIVFGVVANLFFHTFVNVGMVIGILPVVGIPLPLFSYGGSSFLINMFLLALALRVSFEVSKSDRPTLFEQFGYSGVRG